MAGYDDRVLAELGTFEDLYDSFQCPLILSLFFQVNLGDHDKEGHAKRVSNANMLGSYRMDAHIGTDDHH